MAKSPAVVRSPMREREQFMVEQILWRFWGFDPFKVSGARNQMMPIGKDFSSDQRIILECAEAKHQIWPLGDRDNKPIGAKNLSPYVRVRCLKGAEQRREQCAR